MSVLSGVFLVRKEGQGGGFQRQEGKDPWPPAVMKTSRQESVCYLVNRSYFVRLVWSLNVFGFVISGPQAESPQPN